MVEEKERVSDYVRLMLPGERAWGAIIEAIDDDTKRVRIDNHVGSQGMHGYRMDDRVIAVKWKGDAWLVIGRSAT